MVIRATAREGKTTGALNMLQLDENKTVIAGADPDRENFELAEEVPRHEQARRTTDALWLRNRQAIAGLWNGRDALAAGLNAPQARIPSKYFYDPLGSQLFDAITRLPEYYLTRSEAAIFSRYAGDIARAVGTGRTLIDLGAGNCGKAVSLFGVLKPAHYVAVDIFAEYLETALVRLRQQFPDIGMTGLGMDMCDGLSLPASVPDAGRLFFYPGSSIGNFTPEDAAAFLTDLRRQCQREGGLLIGVDLIKEKALLDAAYDDALGVTAAFNLNALNNVNSVLGSNFDVRDWRHCGFFNQTMSRAEMHVETRLAVDVHWPGGARRFEAGERIHTENSYKYGVGEFGELLRRAGFRKLTSWTDQRNWFALFYAAA
jgi:dimethylhistidine N-methyltransferase